MAGSNFDQMKRNSDESWDGGGNLPLDVAGKGSVKAVKGIKYESPAQESRIKDGKVERCCLLDERKDSVHVKQEVIPRGWKIPKEASITQYHHDPVQQAKEEKVD